MKSRGEFAAYPSAYPAPTSTAQLGMTLTEYFMAHAPAEPQPWFKPMMPPEPTAPKPATEGPWGFLPSEANIAEAWRKNPCWDLEKPESGQVGGAKFKEFTGLWRDFWSKKSDYDNECKKQSLVQWPAAWAREQIAILDNLL